MTEIEQQNKALRIRYVSTSDTFDLKFPTWSKVELDYTEAGRLLAGEGAHPTATRGILACAMEADSDTLLVSFVVGSESFTTSPSITPIDHDITFSYQGFVILGSWTAAQRVVYDLDLRHGQYAHAYELRHLHGRRQFHYVATHDASAELVMEAERCGGIGVSTAQVLRAKAKIESAKDSEIAMPPVRDMAEIFPVLRYFTYEHLPTKLQKVSRPLCMMAYEIAKMYGEGADERELAKALDRLLEAKDAAVRAVV